MINISIFPKIVGFDILMVPTVFWFVLGFNDTSTLVDHFVSSPSEREERDSRRDEREGQAQIVPIFLGKNKKNIVILMPAELAQTVVKVKPFFISLHL